MTKREVRSLDGMSAEPEALRLVGYAAKFNQETDIGGYFREKVAPGAFTAAIERGDDVRALLNHDSNIVLGRTGNGTLRLSQDETGLRVEIDLPDTQAARDLHALVKRGDVSQMSFGFIVEKESWEFGEKGSDSLRTIESVRLLDVSPVTYPAYEGTEIAVRSRDEVRNRQEADNRAALVRRLRVLEHVRRESVKCPS